MKRVLPLLLCAVLLFSMIPVFEANAENDTDTTQTVENDFSVSGTNSVGNLLSDGIQQTQEETEPVAVPETESVAAVRKPAVKSAASLADDTYASADGKWSFVPYGEGVEITAYHGTATDVYVPFKVTYNEEDYAVLKLADSLFADNDSLNSVTLGEGILEIGAKTFYDCDNLVCIVTNESLTTIGTEAFYSCDSFNSVILYDAVATIGDNTFAECPSLTIWCNEDTAAHTYATENAIPYEILNPDATPETYIQDGITYYIMNGEAIGIDFDGSTTEVVIPSVIEGYPVTELRETFRNCTTLVSIVLPDSLQTIGTYTFYGCTVLSTITLPTGLLTIPDYAFYNCKSIVNLSLPESIESIGKAAFGECGLESIILPESLISIGISAFYSCKSLKTIIIPDSVTSIGDYAFRLCTHLTSVVIPDGITAISNGLFDNCSGLTTVHLPTGITTIGDEAFYYCEKLTDISLPEGLVSIGRYAFLNCESLTSVIISNSVTSIGNGAFYSCDQLTKVTIGYGVLTIGDSAFAECMNLRSIVIPANVTKIGTTLVSAYTVILVSENSYAHIFAVENDLPYSLYSGNGEPQIYTVNGIDFYILNDCAIAFYYDGTATEVVIPSVVEGYPVTELREVFRENDVITKLTLPHTLKKIGDYAFYNCTRLKNINIPDSVTLIGTSAFYNCESMGDIEFPNGLTALGMYAFYNCKGLTNIAIPGSVSVVGYGAFNSCTNLSDLIILDGVKTISAYAFSYCIRLKGIVIPDSVTNIGAYAFRNCSQLENVIIPDSVQDIGKQAFYGCGVLQSVIIPESVITMGAESFPETTLWLVYENSYAHKFAEKGDFLYYIYDGTNEPEIYVVDGISYYISNGCAVAYNSVDSLTNVIIPAYVAEYPVRELRRALRNSKSTLVSVTLPYTIEVIGNAEFYNFDSLTSVYLPESIIKIDDYAFKSCDSLASIILPAGITSIGKEAFYQCSVLEYMELPNNDTIIGQYAFAYCGKLKTIEVPNGVKSIETRAFERCTGLTSVVIGDSVTSIGYMAFYACSKLQNVVLPNGITDIWKTFAHCTSLTSINIPRSVEIIGEGSFSGCSNLQEVVLPNDLTKIGEYAFQGCKSLYEITIPDSVISIDFGAFAGCSSLTHIELPQGIQTMEREIFSGCSNLQTIVMPENLNTIDTYAFRNCTSLMSIKIPDGVTTIGYGAFENCAALQNVLIPESVTSFDTTAFAMSTILLVYEGSYSHTFAVENNLLYFVIRKTENPEISFGASIKGNVTYLDGSAAANATVEIFYDDGVLKESVVTDETGAYEFTYAEVGAYTIRVTDANGNTASAAVSVKRMNAFDVYLSGDTDMKLKKGYTVSGTVNTYPATITITDEDGNVLSSVETADGSFSFSNISNGTYIITATTETGSVSQEITVFDGDISDIILTVATTSATLWGYVEVEDRELNHHRRNWVEVTVYNADGLAVAQCKTDKDGKYTFTGLPVGEYAIVAETAEMRPDHKHGFDRSHTLTGYAYMDVTEAGSYQVETIVLREENDNKATISGKVTAHGQTQNCQVVLHNVFRSEVASMTTGKNGKYSFKNISDGLYFITATTNSDGMGYAVVVVHNGKVYDETDITVFKSDKVKDREDRFHNDVPHCGSREDALNYRDRIAEEKRFYDGLSEKEKKQLSKDYVNRLDQLIQWITDCTVETGDGVTMEQGGLVISGDEAQNAENITFTLNVTPSEAHNASTDGVHNREDQIHHNINDKSNKHDVLQYYDITLSKEVDGVSTQITSVTKDTEANGKLRVTMEIPEEYRGYKHYTIIHEHCGDVVTLTDLDDDPNTVTFEVKKFSTFVLAGTNITLTEIADEESAIVESWGLTLEDDIRVNFTMTLSEEILADSGAYVEIAVADTVTNIPVADAANGVQAVLAAAQMTDTITLCIVDGSGNRSESSSYTVRQYCDIILADESYSKYHTLAKEMLNYGAMAQVYFDYDADNLANDGITGAAAEAVPENWEKQTVSGKLSSLKFYGASLSFRDKIAVRYYFTGDVTGCSFRDASGNTYTPVAKDDMYYVEIADILPQDLDQQIALTVTDSSGNSLAVSYSPMNYIVRMNEKGSDAMKALLRALYNYHLAAKAFQTETV